MPKVSAYTIELNSDNQRLVAQVNDKIKAGWEPIGGVFVAQTANTPIFLQSMIQRAS